MFREFIKAEEENGNVITFSKEISTEREIAPLIAKTEGKICVFKNIKGYTNTCVVAGIASSRELIARTIGAENKEKIIPRMLECMEKSKKYKKTSDAPFFENEIKNPEIIKHIPLIRFHGKESPFYTSSTIVCARTENGELNYSFHRMKHLGGNKFVIRIVPGRHLSTIFENSKKDLEVAVFCGVHPAVEIAAASSLPFNTNEMFFANALLDNMLECVELDGFDIPSHAEVVMIGKIKKNELAEEGPFLDLTETWDIVREQPVFEVEKLYFREDLMYRTILPGGEEHKLLMGIPQEPRIYKIVFNTIPRVKNVVLTPAGGCWLHAVVSIDKKVEGEGKNAGLAALAAHPSLKRVVVVDADIDATNEREVEWAIATRVQAEKDVIIIPDAKGSSLDPSQDYTRKTTTKWIIDATAPVNRKEEFKKVKIASDEINPSDYL